MTGTRLLADCQPTLPRRARRTTFTLTGLCAAAVLALSACGGGGGDGGDGATSAGAPQGSSQSGTQSSANPGSTSSTPTTAGGCYTVSGAAPAPAAGSGITLLPARGSAVSNYRVLDEPRSAGLCYANYRREQVGLPPLAARDALNTVAQNHTGYMLANATLTHDEVSGKSGYTGATPNARIQIEFHEARPMGVSLPKTVDLRVVETAPGLKTATVTNVLKPATTETGLVVPVPNFIGEAT